MKYVLVEIEIITLDEKSVLLASADADLTTQDRSWDENPWGGGTL